MISVLLSAGLVFSSVFAAVPDKKAEGLLKTYADKLFAAKSLSVDIEAYQGAVLSSKSSMTLAKPNFGRFETGGKIRVFDGKNMSEYFAAEGKYYTREVRKDELTEAFYQDQYMAWAPFFNKDLSKVLKTATYDGTDTIDKKQFDCVKIVVDTNAKKTARLYFDQSDGLVKHVEYALGNDPTKTLVLSNKFELDTVADTKATFKVPEGATLVAEADLVGVKWYFDYDQGLAAARSSGKIMLVDFYADW
jgi:outer membrane lipoprotein-sorting protein